MAIVSGPEQVLLQWLPDNGTELEHLLLDCRAHHWHEWTLLRLRLSLLSRAHHAGHSNHRRDSLRLHNVFSLPDIVQRSRNHTESIARRSCLHREADWSPELTQQSNISTTATNERDFRAGTNCKAQILLHLQNISTATSFTLQLMWQLCWPIRSSLPLGELVADVHLLTTFYLFYLNISRSAIALVDAIIDSSTCSSFH